MTLRTELSIAMECAKRGALVGAFAGTAMGDVTKGVAVAAATTAAIYLNVLSQQIAQRYPDTPPMPKGNG